MLQGESGRANGADAVEEATAAWGAPGHLDLVLAFCSTKQDPTSVARALRERLGDVPIVGCTTAGEHLGGAHFNGHLVVTALETPRIKWATAISRDLRAFDDREAKRVSDELLGALGLSRDEVDPQRHFCLCFIDGLSRKEEVVSSLMADALEGMPLLGGSAGDDLAFARTFVLHGGEAVSGAAVFTVADSAAPFDIVKHQHYTQSLVITRADVPARASTRWTDTPRSRRTRGSSACDPRRSRATSRS